MWGEKNKPTAGSESAATYKNQTRVGSSTANESSTQMRRGGFGILPNDGGKSNAEAFVGTVTAKQKAERKRRTESE